jgi:hypothetical protein
MTMYDIFSHEGSGMGVTVVDDDIRSCGTDFCILNVKDVKL